MKHKLKPCPNCWSKNVRLHIEDNSCFVVCNTCCMQGPNTAPIFLDDGLEKSAIAFWNNLPRRNKWQPAKTAPEDGRNILALLEGCRIPVVLYFGTDGKGNKPRWRKTLRPWHQYIGVPFTHWMPLPDLPEEDTQ